MAEYTSQPVSLGKSAAEIYDKLTDMQGLAQMLTNAPMDMVPDEQRKLLSDIHIDENSIEIPGGPVGSITLVKSTCTPTSLVSFEGKGTPVPLVLAAHLQSTGSDSCDVTVEVSISVPAMMKPMLNGPMNKLVTQVADHLKALNH